MTAKLKTHHCLASLGLTSALLLGAVTTGCTEPSGPRFADASDAQIERTYLAASGHDLVSVLLLGIVFSGQHHPTGCPRVVTEGQDTTVSAAGCTLETGVRMDGSIAIHNLPRWDDDSSAHDASQPGSMELDFRVAYPDGSEIALDGRLELLEEAGRLSSDLTIDTAGIASTSRLDAVCQDEGPCTFSPGSEIEVSDLGRAAVEGTWSFVDPPVGKLTVHGADVLVFDISRLDGHCVPYTAGDRRGIVCGRDFDVEDWFEPPATGKGADAAGANSTDDDWEAPPGS